MLIIQAVAALLLLLGTGLIFRALLEIDASERPRAIRQAVALLTALALFSTGNGCTIHRWNSKPITPEAVAHRSLVRPASLQPVEAANG